MKVSSARRQRGAALIVFATVLVLGALSMLVASLNRATGITERDKKTAEALAQAKAALIARAVTDANMPGSLPCPDLVTTFGTNVPNDGIADMLVGNNCPSYIGRLPWRTLGLPDLRDGSGERLWYALSTNFRDDDSAQPLNSDTPGQLTLKDPAGNTIESNVVAIVFAPGPVVGNQLRDAANADNVANFLEGENANGDTTYVSGPATNAFNDRLMAISGDSLLPQVERVVGKRFRDLPLLNTYYATWGAFPFAAPFVDPSLSFTDPSTPFIGVANTYGGLLPMGAAWTSIPTYTLTGGSADVTCELRNGYNSLANARTRCYITNIVGAPTISITGTLAGLRLWRPHNLTDVNQVRVRVNGINWSASTVTGMNATIGATLNVGGSVTVTFTGRLVSGVERIELRDVVVDPSVDPVDPAYAWFTRNKWNQVMYYAVSPGYAPGGGNACTPLPGTPSCLTVNGSGGGSNTRAMIIMTGKTLSSQTIKPTGNLADYLEGQNATPADFNYENRGRSATFNDQVIVVAP
jgi:hypothetical protein